MTSSRYGRPVDKHCTTAAGNYLVSPRKCIAKCIPDNYLSRNNSANHVKRGRSLVYDEQQVDLYGPLLSRKPQITDIFLESTSFRCRPFALGLPLNRTSHVLSFCKVLTGRYSMCTGGFYTHAIERLMGMEYLRIHRWASALFGRFKRQRCLRSSRSLSPGEDNKAISFSFPSPAQREGDGNLE